MSNYQVDDSIINLYLSGNDLTILQNHMIYSLGKDNDGKNISIFVPPSLEYIERAKLLTQGMKDIVFNLDFSKYPRVNRFLGDISFFDNVIEIVLVAGMPPGFKRAFKASESENKTLIVFDVVNSLMQFEDDNDFYEDFTNYLRYAIVLMILDTSRDVEITDKVASLAHAIHSASYADYIIETNHLDLYDQLAIMTILEYTEYKTIKKVVRGAKKNDAEKYMSAIIRANPELIALGSTGKRYLSSIKEDEAYELFQKSHLDFLKEISKSKINKSNATLPTLYTAMNRIMIFIIAVYAAWFIPAVFFDFMPTLFLFYPFAFALCIIIRALLAYKMGMLSNKRFIVSTLFTFILTLIYLIIIF